MALFTFADRQAAESADSYVLLPDGHYHRLRAGQHHLPVASSVRMADLSQRLAEFQAPEGLRLTPLSHALLAEMAALFFEDALPAEVLLEHHPEELIGYINTGIDEPEKPTARQGRGDDDFGVSILRVADRYKVDPLHVYDHLARVDAERRYRRSAARCRHRVHADCGGGRQVGAGNMKPSALRNTQSQWRREAKGQTGNGSGALSQLNMLAAMALRQRRN